jgi:hypothetical protein
VRASLRRKLTYSNVVSTLCLFVLLGGGAYAALTIPKNSVGSKQIKDGSVALKDIESKARDELQGAAGAQGTPGSPGAPGAAGADGSVVVARPHSTAGATTTDAGTLIPIPMTANTWTQGASETDELPYSGKITYTPPISPGCGSPGALGIINLYFKVNGNSVAAAQISTLLDGVQRTVQFGSPSLLPEPGAATARTLTLEVNDLCPAPGDNFQVSAISFNVVGVR